MPQYLQRKFYINFKGNEFFREAIFWMRPLRTVGDGPTFNPKLLKYINLVIL